MMKDMTLNKQKRKAELYYFVSDKSELAYKDVLKSAMNYGVKINLRIGKGSRLTDSDINKHAGAHFYLSGPPGLVGAYKARLKKMGTKQIHVDYFTGY